MAAVTKRNLLAEHRLVEFDIHGVVGIRLINPSDSDVAAVVRQIGPLQAELSREPDIVVRFVEHLPLDRLQYVELNKSGFSREGFFLLKSNKRDAKVRIAFDRIGARCDIVCESGLTSVPLLMAILNVTAVRRDCVGLHASAFVYKGVGVLTTGWAKGGKTESLLAFAAHGAKYVGDEWILLSGDGTRMCGVPENIRVWDWHVKSAPHLRKYVDRNHRMLFSTVRALQRMDRGARGRWLGSTSCAKLLREALPALERQLNVCLSPEKIFGANIQPSYEAEPKVVFLMMNHPEPEIRVEAANPLEIAKRMASSIEYEQLCLLKGYLEYKFAVPEANNEWLQGVTEVQYGILRRALDGKPAYIVSHPYPVDFEALYEAMRPYVSPPEVTILSPKSKESRLTSGTKPPLRVQ